MENNILFSVNMKLLSHCYNKAIWCLVAISLISISFVLMPWIMPVWQANGTAPYYEPNWNCRTNAFREEMKECLLRQYRMTELEYRPYSCQPSRSQMATFYPGLFGGLILLLASLGVMGLVVCVSRVIWHEEIEIQYQITHDLDAIEQVEERWFLLQVLRGLCLASFIYFHWGYFYLYDYNARTLSVWDLCPPQRELPTVWSLREDINQQVRTFNTKCVLRPNSTNSYIWDWVATEEGKQFPNEYFAPMRIYVVLCFAFAGFFVFSGCCCCCANRKPPARPAFVGHEPLPAVAV
jgi:hypothetical protein